MPRLMLTNGSGMAPQTISFKVMLRSEGNVMQILIMLQNTSLNRYPTLEQGYRAFWIQYKAAPIPIFVQELQPFPMKQVECWLTLRKPLHIFFLYAQLRPKQKRKEKMQTYLNLEETENKNESEILCSSWFYSFK